MYTLKLCVFVLMGAGYLKMAQMPNKFAGIENSFETRSTELAACFHERKRANAERHKITDRVHS